MGPKNLRVLDYFFFLLCLAAVASGILWAADRDEGALRAVVEAPDGTWELPLDRDREVLLEGPVGETLVRVENGSVKVVHSDCRNQTCVAMGSVGEPGGWLACLPNRVFVRVVGNADGDGEEPDALAF